MTAVNLHLVSMTPLGDGVSATVGMEITAVETILLEMDDNPEFIHPLAAGFFEHPINAQAWFTLPVGNRVVFDQSPALTEGGFLVPGVTYYWRVSHNDPTTPGWPTVDGPPFTALSSRIYASVPSLLSVQVPEQSEGLYGALFGWADWAPVGWRLDVTGDIDFNVFDSYDIGDMDYLTIDSLFSPDTTYYWRIFDGIDFYPGDSFNVPFGIPPDELIDQFVYILDPETSVPVNEPQDLQDIPEAHIGAKLRTAADAIRQARVRMRGFTVGGTPL